MCHLHNNTSMNSTVFQRYEHQAECNRKLSREIEEMKKRVQFEKRKSKMSSQTSDDEFYGAQGKRLMIRLQREKINLESRSHWHTLSLT